MAIARHLVTVAELARFVDAGGYGEPSWWTAEGWRWRSQTGIETPRFWGEPEWRDYLVPDHPVVGVSAYEAEAFALFSGARLPSAAEWEAAVRGDDGRRYPWGNEWREGMCGHRDDGTRGTRAVGSFSAGVSPRGVHDLVGSVWQWTSDEGEGGRIACGGAWNNLPWSIGADSRNVFPATARFSHLGFRLLQ